MFQNAGILGDITHILNHTDIDQISECLLSCTCREGLDRMNRLDVTVQTELDALTKQDINVSIKFDKHHPCNDLLAHCRGLMSTHLSEAHGNEGPVILESIH